METNSMTSECFEVLSPIGDPGVDELPSAARVKDLNGKTIALLSNDQFRADQVLAAVAEQIKARYPDARVIPWTEFPALSAMGDVDATLMKVSEALAARRPDAVVSSTGA